MLVRDHIIVVSQCDKSFFRLPTIRQTMSEPTMKWRRLECSEEARSDQMEVVGDSTTHDCDQCHRNFPTLIGLKIHQEKVHKNKPQVLQQHQQHQHHRKSGEENRQRNAVGTPNVVVHEAIAAPALLQWQRQ